MIKVAVIGVPGRMASQVCEAVKQNDGMQLVATISEKDVINSVSLADADVAVEFTLPSSTEANVHACLDAGVNVVVGTTGWNEGSLARVGEHAQRVGRGLVIAPNFSIATVLAMAFSRMAAPYFESAEIIEMHHPDKVDAPSGTAFATAQGIATARKDAGCGAVPDATATDPLGSRGGKVDGISVHAVRLRGLTAHEEILFGNEGEQLILRADSFDRVSFMPGVLRAVEEVSSRVGLTFGLESILGLK